MPGLDAPGTSVPPLRRRVLRRVCRALRSRHPCLLRPLRLHSLTQVPSAGPARPCGGCGRSASIRSAVQEPESPLSLAPTVSRPAPVAPIGLPAQLFRASGVTAGAVTPAVRKSSSDCSERTLGDGRGRQRSRPLEGVPKQIHIFTMVAQFLRALASVISVIISIFALAEDASDLPLRYL